MRKRKSIQRILRPAFFKALGDPNRLALLMGLSCSPNPKNVQSMSKCCKVDLSVVSRHLVQLKEAGILTSEKRGKEVHYSMNAREVARTLRDLARFFESCCPSNPKKGEISHGKAKK